MKLKSAKKKLAEKIPCYPLLCCDWPAPAVSSLSLVLLGGIFLTPHHSQGF